MKVITMESSAFRSLTEQIAEIAAHVRAASGDKKAASPDRLLTTREAAHLLNVSTRTLQRMRSEQRIGYVVLRGKCRYRQSEIDRLLEACAVNEDAATPQDCMPLRRMLILKPTLAKRPPSAAKFITA